MESSIIEMQTALKKKDEHASSLTQSISEKISSSDEYIQSLLSTLEAKEAHLNSQDAQLESARSTITNISAALIEEKKHIERLAGSTLVRVSARIAGINRLTKTDE
jgi:chromosome segregation ATPase